MTVRSKSQLNTDFATSPPANISASELRDYVDTVLPVKGHTQTVAASDSVDSRSRSQADAECDGTADDVQIEAQLAAMTGPGGTLELTEGLFTVAAAIDLNIASLTAPAGRNLIGRGKNATRILANASSFTPLIIGSGTDTFDQYGHVGGFRIESANGSERPTILIDGVRFFTLEDVITDRGKFGIWAQRMGKATFKDIRCRNPETDGAAFAIAAGRDGSSNTQPVAGVVFINVNMEAGADGGKYMFLAAITGSNWGVGGAAPVVAASSTFTNEDEIDELLWLSGAIQNNGQSGCIGLMWETGAWASKIVGVITAGMQIVCDMATLAPSGTHIKLLLDGCSFGTGSAEKFLMDQTNQFVQLRNCRVLDTAGGSGKHLFSLTGNNPRVSIGPELFISNMVGSIIDCSSGSPEVYIHEGIEDGGGGTITPVSGAGTPHIRGNNWGPNFKTCARGTETITGTSVTVTHGLGFTPRASDIVVNFLELPTNDGTNQFSITSITSTQFTITVDQDPGASDLDLEWAVKMV